MPNQSPKQTIVTGDSPIVVLEIQNNLRLKGTDDLEVVARATTDEELHMEEREGVIYIRCADECSVRVPRRARLQLKAVHGNASLKSLEGELSIAAVYGNLDLRSVGPANLERLHGNLSVKNVSGDLQIQKIDGNATVRDIQGSFTVREAINGNLLLSDVDSSISALVEGNATLSLDPRPDETYSITANGNLLCRIPDDTSVVIQISRASKIVVSLPEVETEGALEAPTSLTVGDGDATLTLSAAGNITLAGEAPDWDMLSDFDIELEGSLSDIGETLGQQVTQQIEGQMEMLEQQLNAHLSGLSMRLGTSGLDEERIRRIEQRAREASQRAAERAKEKMRRAQEKLERKLSVAQRRSEQKLHAAHRRAHGHARHSWSFNWPTPPGPPAPPEVDPISDEERLAVLRMLEKKQISLEEAEKLLAALEGKET